jgi:hypothetical protein
MMSACVEAQVVEAKQEQERNRLAGLQQQSRYLGPNSSYVVGFADFQLAGRLLRGSDYCVRAKTAGALPCAIFCTPSTNSN